MHSHDHARLFVVMRWSLRLAALIVVAGSLNAWTVEAAGLNPGDFVLAATPPQYGAPYQILKLDHAGFTPTVISSGPLVTWALHIAVDLRGRILVSDSYAGIVVIDAVTGTQSIFVSAAALGGTPFGIVAAPDGRLYVTLFRPGRILRLDPDTGVPSVVTSGGLLDSPSGLAIGPDGQLYVAESWLPLRGSIVRVDPNSGAQELVATSGEFTYPFDIAVKDGVVWTLQRGFTDGRGGCFEETRLSDGTSTHSGLSTYCRAKGIAIAGDGTIAFSDCIPLDIVCSTLITGRSTGGATLSGLGGPLAAVPDGVKPTPTRNSSWGHLKSIYR